MALSNYNLIVDFLTVQRGAIIGLIEAAYVETGGHYLTLPSAQRHTQAEQDGDEFIASLVRGEVDQALIRSRVQAATDPLLPGDLLQMTGALDRLFRGFVREQLEDQPELADRLASRAHNILACVHMNITAAQIDRMLHPLHEAPAAPPT